MRVSAGTVLLAVSVLILRVDDQTFRQNIVKNLYHGIDKSAAVIAKVDHQRCKPFPFQFRKRLLKLVCRILLKRFNPDITNRIV